MNFKSDKQRKAIMCKLNKFSMCDEYSKLSGASRLEAEIKPMLAPTWREAVDFDNLYNPSLTYAQNKKMAINELKVMIDNKESEAPITEVYTEDIYEVVPESKEDFGSKIANTFIKLYPDVPENKLETIVESRVNPINSSFGDRISNSIINMYPDVPENKLESYVENEVRPVNSSFGDNIANAVIGLYPEPLPQKILVEDIVEPSGELIIAQPVQRKSISDSIADAVTNLWP